MAEVDRNVEALVGLSADDLPDCPWHDRWRDGCSPQRAARRALARVDGDEDDIA